MNIGLKLIYNESIKGVSMPLEGEWLTLGGSALEDMDNINISFQRLDFFDNKNSTILYYSKIILHDTICIKVEKIEKVIEYTGDYVNYVNFIRRQRYNYLHKVINSSIRNDKSIGFKFCINDKIIQIYLLKNRNVGFVINQNEREINLSIGATDKVSDILFKDKSWFESSLYIGDEISIELTVLDEETSPISEHYYELGKPITLEKIIDEYNYLQTELTKEGII